MDSRVVYEVVLPLLQKEGAACIMISTVLDAYNYYTKMTETKYEGKYVFNVIKLNVCEDCRKAGLEDTCRHMIERPGHLQEDTGKIRAIYGKDKADIYKREILGMVTNSKSAAFEMRFLKRFFRASPFLEPHVVVDRVYVAIDPNGGTQFSTGSSSETAIVSFFWVNGAIVVR